MAVSQTRVNLPRPIKEVFVPLALVSGKDPRQITHSFVKVHSGGEYQKEDSDGQ